jgi:hypothetical protein
MCGVVDGNISRGIAGRKGLTVEVLVVPMLGGLRGLGSWVRGDVYILSKQK